MKKRMLFILSCVALASPAAFADAISNLEIGPGLQTGELAQPGAEGVQCAFDSGRGEAGYGDEGERGYLSGLAEY